MGTTAVVRVRRSVLACAFALLASCTDSDEPWAYLPVQGQPLPGFNLPVLGGGRVSAPSLRGAPTVVMFWSTKCRYSRATLRPLAKLQNDYRGSGVRVLVISDDADTARIRTSIERAGVELPVAYASGRIQALFHPIRNPFGRHYEAIVHGVRFAMPSFVLVRADGTVAARTAGVLFKQDSLPVPGMDPKNGRLDHVREALDRMLHDTGRTINQAQHVSQRAVSPHA